MPASIPSRSVFLSYSVREVREGIRLLRRMIDDGEPALRNEIVDVWIKA